MPQDPKLLETVIQLALQIKKILEENITGNPEEVKHKIERVKAIRKEIESYGLMVTIKVELDPNNPEKVIAEVEVLQPREDMTPEQRKLYNKWFAEKNGLPLPED